MFNPLSIVSNILKKKGEIKAAKEQKKADDANLQAQYESGVASETNREDDRLARMQGIANQLKGARALSPEVVMAALKRRQLTSRKGVAADRSKGMGWGMVGGAVSDLGDLAGNYIKGKMMSADSSEPTSLRPPIGGGPVSMGGQSFDFAPRPCPPGQIC